MPWFKVDDGLAFHHKVVAAGNAAMGLWVRAGSLSSQQLTDGFIADHMVLAMGNQAQARKLVEVGLWERVDGGYVFHQWNEDGRQPTREQVENDRAAARERMAKRRGSSQDVRANTDRTSGAVREPRPDQTRTKEQEPSSAVADATRDDVERLCELLADKIESNGSRRPSVTKAWRNSARLMIDRDDLTEERVTKAINWCQADEFWRGVILSMPKLREKYDQIRLAAQRANGTSNGATFDRPPSLASQLPWTLPTPPIEVADDPQLYTEWRTEQQRLHRLEVGA